MFAKVRGNKSITSIVYYNERKVRIDKAKVLHSENFAKDLDKLTDKDKINRFLQRTTLNDRTIKNAVHIKIGFKPTEDLSDDKMKTLAMCYMKGIGFEEQPFLVYRHKDVSQPHMHVVSTNIREDGSRIELRNIIFRKSNEVVAAITEEFSLQRSERSSVEQKESFKVTEAQAVIYGKSPTKRAISDVLNSVIDHYKYTSLNELNAALREYNVVAYRGKESSHLYKLGGIIYQALDENGRRIGSPIKASRFSLHPTLKYLETKFSLNTGERESNQRRVKTAIEWTFSGKGIDWKEFRQSMEKEGINVVVQDGKQDKPGGVYFVDHREKSVFSGESLGEKYSLRALQEKCIKEQGERDEEIQKHRLRIHL